MVFPTADTHPEISAAMRQCTGQFIILKMSNRTSLQQWDRVMEWNTMVLITTLRNARDI